MNPGIHNKNFNTKTSAIAIYQALKKLSQTKNPTILASITINLVNTEITKCCGNLPLDEANEKLISNLLTTEQLEVLERYRPLMREVIRQARKDFNLSRRDV